MKQNLIVCIPQALMPDYVEKSAKENGDKPEDYSTINCPDCDQPMWMGPRTKALYKSGVKATCGVCAILVHKITREQVDNMVVMTKVKEA